MIRILLIAFLLVQFPLLAHANYTNKAELKAAFIREGNLWIYSNDVQLQITKSGKAHSPKWSPDGKLILFQLEAPSELPASKTQSEIWVYNAATNKTQKIFHDGYNPQWSPNQNLVAFQDRGVLDLSDLKRFYNVSLGVDHYAWLPDGNGFLISSSATLRPDGWTNAILYRKTLEKDFSAIQIANVNPFFVIPKKLQKDDKKIMSIQASYFNFSPSQKWLSFIVSPTASWSMDSNMLCAITSTGKKFEVVDEVIKGIGEPKWAPNQDVLGYIAGGGRIVFGFKNKKLNVWEVPASASLTPKNYAELNFTWKDDQSIITSRVHETEWSNDVRKHPLPSLYSIDIKNNIQTRITYPPQGKGDYDPHYLKGSDKIVWYRSESMFGKKDLWISNPNGKNRRELLGNVDQVVFA